MAFHEILIPTKDFARGMNLTKLLLNHNYHVITPGPVGSGKTTNAMKILSEYLDKNYLYNKYVLWGRSMGSVSIILSQGYKFN